MVNYKAFKFRSFEGEHLATISEVYSEPNQFYDPKKENSTEETLTIVFVLEDENNTEFTQKFISPLSGGKSLFQQLLDCIEFLPDLEGGGFNESLLVGLKVKIKIEKNQKGFDKVVSVEKASGRPTPKKKQTPEEEKKEALDFFSK